MYMLYVLVQDPWKPNVRADLASEHPPAAVSVSHFLTTHTNFTRYSAFPPMSRESKSCVRQLLSRGAWLCVLSVNQTRVKGVSGSTYWARTPATLHHPPCFLCTVRLRSGLLGKIQPLTERLTHGSCITSASCNEALQVIMYLYK